MRQIKKSSRVAFDRSDALRRGGSVWSIGGWIRAAKVSAADEETPKVTVTSMEYYPNEETP